MNVFEKLGRNDTNGSILNDEVSRRIGIEMELASRVDQRVLRWFGLLDKLDEYRMARMLMVKVSIEGAYGVDRG